MSNDSQPEASTSCDLPEIELTPYRRIIYVDDGEERVGKINSIDGDYIRLVRGVAIHIHDIKLVGVYSDEAEFVIPEENQEIGE